MMANALTREQVYALIDVEREHQNRKFPGTIVSPMQFYLLLADRVMGNIGETSPAESPDVETVREIAALCVRWMEENGSASRVARHE